MAADRIYPTEGFKCWEKAKELRVKYYRDYMTAKDRGAIRWAGNSPALDAIPYGLGDDVCHMTGEPYGASVAYNKDFARRCHEAVESRGYARDLCAYMRNYWGSILLDECVFGGPFPKPDFMWVLHVCCSHGKWYQEASRLEGGIPYFIMDWSAGSYFVWDEAKKDYVVNPDQEHRIVYMVNQMQEGIQWLEQVTGRPYDDERLIRAAGNYFESTSLWTEICALNAAVPAAMDEKAMYSFYVFSALHKAHRDVVEFYRELRDEIADRVTRGIAAVPNERARIMTDIQPPWGFLEIYRYMEAHGCVSIGSFYTFSLMGHWEIGEGGDLRPRTTPMQKGVEIRTREQALRFMAEWVLGLFMTQIFYDHRFKSHIMKKIYRQWKCDGAIIHFNRGCEGLSLGVAENKLALSEAGIPVAYYEGNMGDEREFDLSTVKEQIDAFLETLGLKR
ncbi:MAG: benzoyl-CoA reductase, bzd-type, subunit O [Thermodesulfobacteriota bacterium]